MKLHVIEDALVYCPYGSLRNLENQIEHCSWYNSSEGIGYDRTCEFVVDVGPKLGRESSQNGGENTNHTKS